VPDQDPNLAEAVGALRGDEIRVEHLQHADAQAAHEQRHDREARL